jgi:flagellar biogenesis protein FliO
VTGLVLATSGWLDGLRRRAASLSLPARHAHVVQALPVGPGARLLVVEFGGRRLLIGQSRTGLATLSEDPTP